MLDYLQAKKIVLVQIHLHPKCINKEKQTLIEGHELQQWLWYNDFIQNS